MLIPLEKTAYHEFAEQAYKMALIPANTSYPIYYDGIKTKANFLHRAAKAFEQEHEEILLFRKDGAFSGWLHVFALPEDRYLSTVSMAARTGMEQMLEEFLEFAAKKYPNYKVYLGFPEENQAALLYLQTHGFAMEEQSWNMVLPMADWTGSMREGDFVIAIGKENYALFDQIHSQWDGKMYWDNRHIYADLSNWLVFVAMEQERPIAAIYCMRGKMAEIFGIDFAEGRYDGQILNALLTAMIRACRADGTENLVYFCNDQEKAAVLGTGFTCVGKYCLVERLVCAHAKGEDDFPKV